jgi:hypothetical protein
VGYTTDFTGHCEIEPPLTAAQVAYVNAFCCSRRMKRRVEDTSKLTDTLREAVGLPIGIDGEFYVGGGLHGYNEKGVVDSNGPPSTQPGLWCQWIVSEDGKRLEWDGGEKFYNYIEWLQYMIKHFFDRWHCVVNGKVDWQGEDSGDSGTIVVTDNSVRTI